MPDFSYGELGTKHIFAGETRVLSKLVKTPPTVTSNTDTDFPGAHGILNALGRGRGNKFGIFKRLEREEVTLPGTLPVEKDQFYYHTDHLGSSNIITDIAGSVYQHLEYFPYGETWIEEGGSYGGNTLGYKFTGKELDPETGLYYYGARYYDPVLSRWISADPIDRFNPQTPPIALSLYQYGLHNPIRYTDPTGKEEDEQVDKKLTLAERFGKWVRETFGKARGEVQEARFKRMEEAGLDVSAERQAEAEMMEEVGAEQEKVATQYAETAIEAVKSWGYGKALGTLGGIFGSIKKVFGIGKEAKALEYALNPNKLRHIFDNPEHGLDILVTKFGSRENVMKEIITSLGKLPESGTFQVVRNIGGVDVTIKGKVIDGVPMIGTMYIKQ